MTPELQELADELAHAREPDSFRRLMGEREMDVRRVLIDNRGLSSVYERQATVRGWLHKYITGHLTWQGALLLAYRALAFEYVETCRYIPVQMPRLDARLITLETVAPAHVIDAAGLVHAVNCRTVREAVGRPRKTPLTAVPDAAE